MSAKKRNFDGTEKRKHVSITVLQKVEIIKKLDAGATVNFLAAEFGISSRTVYDIKKNKEKILQFYASSDSNAGISKKKTIRSAKSEKLDSVLYEWFLQRRSEGVPITGPLLREKAQELHRQLDVQEACSYSSGWLTSFKKRHGIRYLKACGEKLSADVEAAESFVEKFSDLLLEENLSPEQIYNADESGLFWRCLPRDTLVSSEEENPPSGFKEAKERITVLLCSNAAGTHKCKLMVIGKAAHPRALKGVKALPVIYKNNKKAWINRDLMTEWFENHFVKEARNHCSKIGLPKDCKIVLLLDNCSAHPEGLQKDNVSVLFLPPNTTSLIQPLDQGIIHSVKTRYKTEFLRRLIALNPSADVVSEYKKGFTIKDCIYLLAEAWITLPQDVLVNSWHNIWPSSLFFETEGGQIDFSGFRLNNAKEKSVELLNFAKNSLNSVPTFLEEQNLVQWLVNEDEPPIHNSVTDEEIIASVLNPIDNIDSDTESDDEGPKLTQQQGLELGYKYLNFLEKQDYISEQEIMMVNRLQKKIIDNKPKLKQTTIVSMYKKLNN